MRLPEDHHVQNYLELPSICFFMCLIFTSIKKKSIGHAVARY